MQPTNHLSVISVIHPQPNFTRKATAYLHSFIPICDDSKAVDMVTSMKNIFAYIYIFVLLVSMSGCSQSGEQISDGIFVAERNRIVSIYFYGEEEFMFLHTPESSDLTQGKYECKGGKVFATDEEDIYVFEIQDPQTMIFLKSESAQTPLEEGMIFKLKLKGRLTK